MIKFWRGLRETEKGFFLLFPGLVSLTMPWFLAFGVRHYYCEVGQDCWTDVPTFLFSFTWFIFGIAITIMAVNKIDRGG